MRKQTLHYSSPLDALIEVTKRLSFREMQEQMDSDEFFHQYSQGRLSDDSAHVEWANDYRHYLSLHQELKNRLKHAA